MQRWNVRIPILRKRRTRHSRWGFNNQRQEQGLRRHLKPNMDRPWRFPFPVAGNRDPDDLFPKGGERRPVLRPAQLLPTLTLTDRIEIRCMMP